MGLFGKTEPPDPRKKVREMSAAIRKEQRLLQRQINKIDQGINKVKLSLKKSAKDGDKQACNILAKEILHSRKAIGRIHVSIAQLKSVEYNIKNQAAMVKVAGAFEKSTQVMQAMQKLVKVAEVRDNMMNLSKEMTKMGIMEEMLEDTMDVMDDDEIGDEETQDEIDKVLYEITAGTLGKLPEAESGALPEVSKPGTSHAVEVSDEEEEEEEDELMQRRLAALRS